MSSGIRALRRQPGGDTPSLLTPRRWHSAEQAELASKVTGLFETLVHAGEADGGDIVERPEPFEDGKSKLLARDLPSGRPRDLFHLTRERFDRLQFDGAVLACRPHAADDLAALEGLTLAGTFHDDDGLSRALIGGEATRATDAF